MSKLLATLQTPSPLSTSKTLVLVTGGTLDKDYIETSGELSFISTHLPEMLKQANLTLDLEIQTLMLKDSLEMDEADRNRISKAVLQAPYSQILVTHGTDTMAQSAQTIIEHLKVEKQPLKKTIVFTGAMRPFKLGKSDALFNLGSALTAVQLLPAGCFIAMNGRIHSADKVYKNLEKGIFESI
ncbi:asparaginase domain-containing protein [Thiomicrorhabdus indica]|uniref:asparaginase domain-containing protein n=1 Tax=Thiomicrorhabdus indica TaxID=2267253 RepID=UPI00102DC1F1|nr:asparaginase domain-containing protein [Thiomicrorhabdus indica]